MCSVWLLSVDHRLPFNLMLEPGFVACSAHPSPYLPSLLLPLSSPDLGALPPCSWDSSWQLGRSWAGIYGAGTFPRAH
jgi:hypothetical protein